MGRLDQKRVLITGAGSGIGAGFATAMANEGATIGILDLNLEAAQKVADQIVSDGGSAIALAADVADRSQIAAAIQKFVAFASGLDVIFNNAGFNKPMPLLEVTEENFNAIMRVNGLGVLIGIQEAAKVMISQGTGGKIINTSSVAGRQGYPDFAPYSASKFAVNALTQAAARGLAEHGITCNSFSPGVVDTPLWVTLDKDLIEMGATKDPGQAIDEFSADILIGRPALAQDLVGTAIFLASGDSDYMTGQTIMIDGGKVLL
ncbi:MAG: SDR family oxidoreductase [Micrococcales bacterium]|jgi:meso-butanediol dehydrogenase/(S,S)-butanediol dehydrogenase/diacetyl reductase|nr:SDR family oxidoreductase [Micrococcales bacterium]MBT5398200.1 SDR family oxidoreductase [Micrococcales bacterium]MBT5848697.1 SDR family oxidoreductase [Micrococcales bacterium]